MSFVIAFRRDDLAILRFTLTRFEKGGRVMVRAEPTSPISLLEGPPGPRPSDKSAEARPLQSRLEDWIVGTIADPANPTGANEWERVLDKLPPSRRTSKKSGKTGTTPGGWSRFRLDRVRGITVVMLTDESLIRDRELSELAGDVLALVEAGYHRLVLNFSGVERLSTWATGRSSTPRGLAAD